MESSNNESFEYLSEVYDNLVGIIVDRYRKNAQLTNWDVYRVDEAFIQFDPQALQYIYTNREHLIAIMNDPVYSIDLVNLFVDASINFTYKNSQYVQIDTYEESRFREIYQGYVQRIKGCLIDCNSRSDLKNRLNPIVKEHFLTLRKNLTRFFDPETGKDVRSNVILTTSINNEYTPPLQLKVLGTTPQALFQPVLDLGCGRSGKLVKYLRSKGVTAFGVDRIVESSEYLQKSDWLSLPLEPNSWGSIISHMAFSNHFIFHHLYKKGKPDRYARQYMALLGSLRPDGTFYYAPGLPFIEEFLDAEKFILKRRVIVEFDVNTIDTPLDRNTLYATQITKRWMI